ncbi:hypothetical protein PIROE2DRAFT_23908, partial [Piromyces sp. E2]
WEDDKEVKECSGCHSKFSFINRKHHCRVCGKIFCANCVNNTVKLSIANQTLAPNGVPAKVCNCCY